MTTFQPGAQLCQRFYEQAVRPLLNQHFPGLPHAAALLDGGSEVLGFDDVVSTDHHWGPRLQLFLHPADHARDAAAIHAALGQYLPYEFEGYPTSFSAPDPLDNGTQLLERRTTRPVNHRVTTHTLAGFAAEHLNVDLAAPLAPADWLTFSEQRLLMLTTGPAFHDAIGLGEVRSRFHYYPHEVWLYLLAAGWARLAQEEHLMGRAGSAGDELGSAVIGARLVRDVMRLCFLQERRYAPYAKWLGTAFQQLAAGPALAPTLTVALQAATWPERERCLVPAYEYLAARHNALGLTQPLPTHAKAFWGRPFQVLAQHGFAQALLGAITDPAVQALAQLPLIGSLDQFSDNTDLTSDPFWRPRLRGLYAPRDE
jgi:hypothetical protein